MSKATTAPKVLAHLRTANEISKRFQIRLEKDAADAEAVRSAVPAAIKALEANERIFSNQKESVSEKIASSHVACLELIRDLAAHRNAAELDSIGNQVTGQEKKASDGFRATGAGIADFDDTKAGDAYRRKLLGN